MDKLERLEIFGKSSKKSTAYNLIKAIVRAGKENITYLNLGESFLSNDFFNFFLDACESGFFKKLVCLDLSDCQGFQWKNRIDINKVGMILSALEHTQCEHFLGYFVNPNVLNDY